MDFIPPPPTSPQLDDVLPAGGVPVPRPRSPTIWQDTSDTDLCGPPPSGGPLPMMFTSMAPTCVVIEPPRGRSRSRSPLSPPRSLRSYSPIYVNEFAGRASRRFSYVSPSRSLTQSRSRSRSPSPCRCPRRSRLYRSRSMTPSPERRYGYHELPPPPIPPPIIFPPPPPQPIFVRPSMSPQPLFVRSPSPLQTSRPALPPIIIQGPESCMTPPPPISPIPLPGGPPYEPVDIVTFNHNNDMAYAPAAKTYDEAIDTVVELWPELGSVDRDRISLLVGGSDQLVRVPKVAWRIVLGDLPRYEVMHVHVDHQPPPPQYQGDEKNGKGDGKWADEDANKGRRRSRGLFSLIKGIFGR